MKLATLFFAVLIGTANAQEMTGVNMAGADFASSKVPGELNRDYLMATNSQLDLLLDKGFNHIRLPFRWERLQRTLNGSLTTADISHIGRIVAHVTGRGATISLDLHNYGKYKFTDGMVGFINMPATNTAKEIPTAALVDFWVRMANRYKSNPKVIFGLMNEPHKQTPAQWREVMDAVAAGIRGTGATNLILVPGSKWDGAHSWVSSGNAAAFQSFTDPNFAFEMHQYFDSNNSGTHDACVSTTIGAERMAKATKWLRDNNKRGYMGEFGITDNLTCLAAGDGFLKHMKDNPVWIGWAYWAAGAWWGGYRFNVHPPRGVNQTALLLRYINSAPDPVPDQSPPAH